jgi:hypothetical protein
MMLGLVHGDASYFAVALVLPDGLHQWADRESRNSYRRGNPAR